MCGEEPNPYIDWGQPEGEDRIRRAFVNSAFDDAKALIVNGVCDKKCWERRKSQRSNKVEVQCEVEEVVRPGFRAVEIWTPLLAAEDVIGHNIPWGDCKLPISNAVDCQHRNLKEGECRRVEVCGRTDQEKSSKSDASQHPDPSCTNPFTHESRRDLVSAEDEELFKDKRE